VNTQLDSNPAPVIWVLKDERPGTANQCLGVAEALGLPYEVKYLTYGALGKLPNALVGASLSGLKQNSKFQFIPPWPDVVISAGRRAGAVARYIKRQSKGATRLAQIMYPGMSVARDFDLIAVPNHDSHEQAENQFVFTGAPHAFTPATFTEAADKWRETFAGFRSPKIGLAVGGATKRRKFTFDIALALGHRVGELMAEREASLLMTTSPRTGEAAEAVLEGLADKGEEPDYFYRWGRDEGANPYLGILSLADILVITGDSVSMCSEACATGKPVYIFAPPGSVSYKHNRLHQELYEKGHAKNLDIIGDDIHSDWRSVPLNAAEKIANEIRKRLAL